MGYGVYHSFKSNGHDIPRRYVRKQYKDGTLTHEAIETVYVASVSDFMKLLEHWNRLGSYASYLGGYTYTYQRV